MSAALSGIVSARTGTSSTTSNAKNKLIFHVTSIQKQTMITIASHRKRNDSDAPSTPNTNANNASTPWQAATTPSGSASSKRKVDAMASAAAPTTPVAKLANKSATDAKSTIPPLALAATTRQTVTFSNLLETPRGGVRASSAANIVAEIKQTIVRGGATLTHLENAVGKPLATRRFTLDDADAQERRGLKSLFAQIKVLAAGYSRVGSKLVEIDAPSAALELVRRFLELFAEPMVRFVTSVAAERANLQALYQFVESKPSIFPELPAHDDGSLADRSLHGHFMLPLRLLRAISELVVDADAAFEGDDAALAKRVLAQLADIRAQMRTAAQAAANSVDEEAPPPPPTPMAATASPQTPKATARPATLQRRMAPNSERRASENSSTAASAAAAFKLSSSMRFTPKQISKAQMPLSPDSPPPPPPPSTPLTMLRGTLKRARTPLSPLFDANNKLVDLSDVESCVTASPNKTSRKWQQ
jgi:hypothetical protein